MTALERRILDALRHLPPERTDEVLDFVEFLRLRHDQDAREDEADLAEAREILDRVKEGQEETIPWAQVKAEHGL